jgi:ADP-ribose diphosphatase
MHIKPHILRTATVAESRIFRIERLDLRFANGVERQYERVVGHGRGAVLVVPMADPGSLILVREYAAGIDSYELGFPKGRLEGTETLAEAAQREIREEIGYGAHDIRLVRRLSLAPGYFSHATYVMLARELYPSPHPGGDEPEDLEIVTWPLSRLDALLAREDFSDARNIAALLLTRPLLHDPHTL